ncbi:extracellular solute-binding protein [Candidatus Parcubacteria bacterium]|nr:extracellular solute-binding protein [Candidatus Parcubacteria bacterium]
MSKFQLILTGVFGAFIVLGVILFAGSQSNGKATENVVIWGTLPAHQDHSINLSYVEKSPQKFDQDLIEALAVGKGPDIILLDNDSILKHANKIYPIPFQSYSERIFKDTFIQEGELFLSPSGIYGLPFSVDPLVMYWNRDIFSNASLPSAPAKWEEFQNVVAKLTKKNNSVILQSAVALGEFSNIDHAKEILTTLIQQAGNPLTAWQNGKVVSTLGEEFNTPIPPTQAALDFYTEFSNPIRPFYSWNRSLPSSKSFFLSGDLAMYFGFASELAEISQKNPNLNFDVAYVPQSNTAPVKTTYGHMQAFAIMRTTHVFDGAIKTAEALTAKDAIALWTKYSGLPPVRRDLLSQKPGDAYKDVFYESALRSRAWIDPNHDSSTMILKNMVESVTSGKSRSSEAVTRAANELGALFK